MAGGTFESDTDGTFHCDIPGTFQSAVDGTFDSATDGTFQSDMGGTFGPLLSISDKIGNISSKIKLEDRILRAYIRQKEWLLKQMFI